MKMDLTRRGLVMTGGALTVSVMLPGQKARAEILGAQARPALTPENLSSYISLNADGSVIAYWGKLDLGQGTDVGIAQMVAEELNLPVEKVSVIQSDTARTINQGGASGSMGIQGSGKMLQRAAAEAHLQLLEMASKQLGAPTDKLVSDNGVVTVAADPAKRVTYAELIGGRYFDTQLEWNGKIGNMLAVTGRAKVKPASEHRVIGTSLPRRDIAWKIMGTDDYVVDIKVPGMHHARVIRPPVAGSVPVSFDKASVADIPGVQVVQEKAFLAVVAPKEWDAVRAAQQLAVTWSDFRPNFPTHEGVYDHLRKAKPLKRAEEEKVGDVDAAFASASRVVEANYDWPFQSHASMGPACAVVEVKGDSATLWTATQKPHYAAQGVATMLGLAPEKVRAIWVAGPGSYGRNDAGDAALDAALIAKLTGKPIRVQGSRRDGTAWDPKGPASVHSVRAALDNDNKVTGWRFETRGFSRTDVRPNESALSDTLAGQQIDVPLQHTPNFGIPFHSYGFPARLLAWETVPPLLDRASPLRTAHLREPVGPQINFAFESFIDELALSVGMDPVAFRLKNLTDDRDIAVVKTAAEKAGWKPRTKPRLQKAGGTLRKGQGVAYSQRLTRVAMVCDLEIDTETGAIRVRKFTVAHDCGMIINPRQLRRTIECSVVQAMSRSLHEEVKFDADNVTSEDWVSYPILDITEAPDEVDIVLIDRKDLEPTGAAEASLAPVPAAIANAIFDATGVRVRKAPFTPEILRAAGLKA